MKQSRLTTTIVAGEKSELAIRLPLTNGSNGAQADPFAGKNHSAQNGSLKIREGRTRDGLKDNMEEEKTALCFIGEDKTPKPTRSEDQFTLEVKNKAKILIANARNG